MCLFTSLASRKFIDHDVGVVYQTWHAPTWTFPGVFRCLAQRLHDDCVFIRHNKWIMSVDRLAIEVVREGVENKLVKHATIINKSAEICLVVTIQSVNTC